MIYTFWAKLENEVPVKVSLLVPLPQQRLMDLIFLQEQLGDYEDDCLLFDCPGQIELYTHMDVMKRSVVLFAVCTLVSDSASLDHIHTC